MLPFGHCLKGGWGPTQIHKNGVVFLDLLWTLQRKGVEVGEVGGGVELIPKVFG